MTRRRTGKRYIASLDTLPRARTADPITSHVAGEPYEDQTLRPNTIRHKALSLYEHASNGLVGIDLPNGWWKRVSELRRFGLIRNTGVTRNGGEVHVITDHGRHVLIWLDNGKQWPP